MSGRWQARLWFTALGVALVASLVLGPRRIGGEDLGPETSLEHWQLLGDRKLGRIAERFAGDTPVRRPLAEWNHEGIRLDVLLDPRELELMRLRSNREFYKDNYVEVALRFGDAPPLTAAAALRGRQSLDQYDELSFKVKLAQPERLTSEVTLRRFYLLALVEDEHKVKARFAAELYSRVGAFPLHYQIVDLYLNGERQGVALLVESPVRGIRRVHPSTTAIHRRYGVAKVYLPYWNDGSRDAEASMARLRTLNDMEQLEDPVGAYERALDLELYLKHLGASSILMNQDTMGELFLYETRGADGAPEPVRVSAWDVEDVVFMREKRHGFDSPLMFWAQGFLDHRIGTTPALLERYRATLAELLANELSYERVAETLLSVQALIDAVDEGAAEREARAAFVEEALVFLERRHEFLLGELAR